MNSKKKEFLGWPAAACALVLVLAGCAGGVLAWETTGEKFRKVLAAIDENCRDRKLGPYLDPADPEYRNKSALTNCDILKLEPRDWRTVKMVKLDSQSYPVPEHWLAMPEGRFAHSIRLPATAQMQVFDMGRVLDEHAFEKLCSAHAIERVFSTAKGVSGVVQARPIPERQSGYLNLAFWTREKGDIGQTPQDYLVQPPLGGYEFLEVARHEKGARRPTWIRYARGPESSATRSINEVTRDGRAVRIPYIVTEREVPAPQAQFAYTWRGIWPGNWLENGVEGEELIVYRVQPFEVMGIRRSFRMHRPDLTHSDRRMTWTDHCKLGAPHQFIAAVLQP